MKHKVILAEGDGQQLAHVVPHRSWRVTLLAGVVCILLAFVVWFCVMNAMDTDYVRLDIQAPREGYTYVLSVDGVEVSGPVYALKGLHEVGVVIPGHVPGVYTLSPADLILPEGVTVDENLRLTLTVSVS